MVVKRRHVHVNTIGNCLRMRLMADSSFVYIQNCRTSNINMYISAAHEACNFRLQMNFADKEQQHVMSCIWFFSSVDIMPKSEELHNNKKWTITIEDEILDFLIKITTIYQ